MDYFRILNLEREPFSNSPEPDLFYLSDSHWECLQKLELALRLRRGLNIVLGEVGTGKTTLCRHLILKLEKSDKQDRPFVIQLLLDPEFASPREFLASVAEGFGINLSGPEENPLSLKEKIKDYLFQKAVTEEKLPILIIDEGQKLPPFCLENLRELLNYETGDRKLLQIVIFAQIEFKEAFSRRPNFVDRVNQILFLKPLGLGETIKLIEFRLAKTRGSQEGQIRFSWSAYLALWRLSAGYPRRIVAIAHHVLVGLITQGKKKATGKLVRASAQNIPERLFPRRRRYRRSLAILATVVALAGIAIIIEQGVRKQWLWSNGEDTSGIMPPALPVTTPPPPPPLIAEPHAWLPAEVNRIASAPPLQEKKKLRSPQSLPPEIGSITVENDSTLSHLAQAFYGRANPRVIAKIMEYNEHITDPNHIRAGNQIRFPTLKSPASPQDPGVIFIEINQATSLPEIFRRYREQSDSSTGLRIFIFWTPLQGLSYSLILRETFRTKSEAASRLENLDSALRDKARLLLSWPAETIFITACNHHSMR